MSTDRERQERFKRAAAEAALRELDAWMSPGDVIGIGTGSTTNHFIDLLATRRADIGGAVSSSRSSTERLGDAGILVIELDHAGPLSLYVDGADEANRSGQLIKGGGGALTREKVIAAASRRFVCLVDDSKLKSVLGGFPVPVEVIPMAQNFVARKIADLGGRPELREGFETDNGNVILDIHDLRLTDAAAMEWELTTIPGVLCAGIFAHRTADVILVGGEDGVEVITH